MDDIITNINFIFSIEFFFFPSSLIRLRKNEKKFKKNSKKTFSQLIKKINTRNKNLIILL